MRLDYGAEREQLLKLFEPAPDADTIRCTFRVDHSGRLPARIEVVIHRDEEGCITIDTKDSLYPEIPGLLLQHDMASEPTLFFRTNVAIGSDGQLVRATSEDARKGQVEDLSDNRLYADRAFKSTFVHTVGQYVSGTLRGGGGSLKYEQGGDLVKEVEVSVAPT
ncbi:MAG: hypothetical protein IRY99_02510 [Isosphaeraceae bacterium]|nr:hypothetical protein [Isosphaeraceae bacterium]